MFRWLWAFVFQPGSTLLKVMDLAELQIYVLIGICIWGLANMQLSKAEGHVWGMLLKEARRLCLSLHTEALSHGSLSLLPKVPKGNYSHFGDF